MDQKILKWLVLVWKENLDNVVITLLLFCLSTFEQKIYHSKFKFSTYFFGKCNGWVDSVLALYFDNQVRIPAEDYSFFAVKFVFEKN